MHLNDDPLSMYDILELTPDATPQEIRSAYLRLRSAYGKDNIAHYSVFSREETEQMLQNVETAYLVLSNPEKRRVYDQNQGLSNAPQAESNPAPVVGVGSASLASLTLTQTSSIASLNTFSAAASTNTLNELDSIIQQEENWTGPAIRRIREAKRISLEDLSDYTRISRSYLHALEEENFSKLPAVVYVRGFLQQISKRLKLPTELVTRQYLEKMKASQPDKG
jgi:curved DNA-binding protein CbpA